MYDFLKQVPLFSSLSDEDLSLLCGMISQQRIAQGEILFTEGSEGNEAYVIKEGRIQIFKSVAGREVQLAVRGSGEVIGEVALLEAVPRTASGRAQEDSLLYIITNEQMDRLLNHSPSAAINMLHTVTARLKSTEQMLQQTERLAQLGMLTAGIAHEINNPVAAIQRGVSQLGSALERLTRTQKLAHQESLSEDDLGGFYDRLILPGDRSYLDPSRDLLWRSDQEYRLGDWLNNRGIVGAWDLAESLVRLGITLDRLEGWSAEYAPTQLQAALNWFAARAELESIFEEVRTGSGRVAEIVKALKAYVYLDQGPSQRVDVHEGLENTLVILRSMLKQGIRLRREYAPNLPQIEAYGSELNQVWTNLIANAIEAMGEAGELVIRTRLEEGWLVVEIQDSGPGIPPEIREKIFHPFFTTKPVGQGTGLGLSISENIIQKHGGEIRVASRPGWTCFQVLLPTHQTAGSLNGKTAADIALPQRG